MSHFFAVLACTLEKTSEPGFEPRAVGSIYLEALTLSLYYVYSSIKKVNYQLVEKITDRIQVKTGRKKLVEIRFYFRGNSSKKHYT